ncbi:MAG: hypothetical protein ACKOOH_04575, partial [Cyanobium sp.]
EGNGGDLRSTLGLPQEEVPTNPSGDTLLVLGVVTPSGYWELSPWHGPCPGRGRQRPLAHPTALRRPLGPYPNQQ